MKISFSDQIIKYFGLLFLTTITIIFSLWYFGLPQFGLEGASDQRTREAMHIMELKADYQLASISNGMREIREDVGYIAENLMAKQRTNDMSLPIQKNIEYSFDRIQRAYPNRIEQLIIVDPYNGKILASSVADELGKIFPDQDLIKRASQPGATELIEQLSRPNLSKVAIVRQMYSWEKKNSPRYKVVALLIALIDPRYLIGENLQEYLPFSSKHGTILLFDPTGKLLAGYPEIPADAQTFKISSQLEKGFEGALIDLDPSGEERLTVYRHFQLSGTQNWMLVHYLNKQEALSGLKGNVNTLLFVGIVLSLISMVLIKTFAKRLTLPLNLLSKTAREFGAGNLSARAINLQGENKEFANLSNSFNLMAQSIQEVHRTLESKVRERTTELQQSEIRYRTLYESTPDAIVIANQNGIIDCNPSACRMFGVSNQKSLVGVHPGELSPKNQINGEDSHLLADLHMKQALSEGYLAFEWLHRRLDTGATFFADVILNKIQIGQEVLLQATVRDVTERKQAQSALIAAKELAEKAAALKSQFLDIAAHELRTPVTAFTIFLQIAQKQLEKGHPIELSTIVRIRSQADRLSRLVVSLLDVSRLERGMTLALELTDMVKMISGCIEDMSLRAPKREIIFSKPNETISISIDPLRIYQVVSNLLDNALKYTPENTPIEIAIESSPESVKVFVTDHGPGIAEEQLSALFEPFTRGKNDEVIRSVGMGLGLYISRVIIELHGGKIWVTSKIGVGTTFTFELPKKDKAR